MSVCHLSASLVVEKLARADKSEVMTSAAATPSRCAC